VIDKPQDIHNSHSKAVFLDEDNHREDVGDTRKNFWIYSYQLLTANKALNLEGT